MNTLQLGRAVDKTQGEMLNEEKNEEVFLLIYLKEL
jgi:hypothetical protein